MGVADALVPTLLTTVAVCISWFDVAFIQEKVHGELPDAILIGSSDARERLLSAGDQIAELPTLSIIQKDQIKGLCAELRASGGLTRDGREHIVQMCAGAALLIAFAANIVVAIATAVFTILAINSFRLTSTTITTLAVLLVGYQMWHIAARVPFSQIEEYHLTIPGMRGDRGPTWGTILRIELIMFNFLLFVELALSI